MFPTLKNRILWWLLLAVAVPVFAAENTTYSAEAASDNLPAIRPGDGAINGSFLKPCENKWKMTMTDPKGVAKDMGIWTDKLEEVTINGRKLMRRTQVSRDTNWMTNVFDPVTMLPLSDDRRVRGQTDFIHRNFYGDRVKLYGMPSDKAELEVDVAENKYDLPVYDFYGGMYGMLLVAAPLKEGYAAKLPSPGEFDNDLHWVPFQVLKEEMTGAGSGKQVKAWVVLSDTYQGKMKFWLTREAPYVIRLEFTAKNGNIWAWEMI
jgi:hypothetical protein